MSSSSKPYKGLKTLLDFVRWGASRFAAAGLHYGHGTDNPVDEALVLVRHALHLGHDLPRELYASRLTKKERAVVAALIERRIDERLPAPYLTGEAWFAGLPFYVDPAVLIPRSPFAELAQQAFQPWVREEGVTRVLDLCSGSGCIAAACAVAFPEAEVDAVELSPPAAELARRNMARHGLEERVHVLEGDLWAPVAGRRYELIVSNPPYVGDAEMDALPAEYRHEPDMALRAQEDGLAIVRRILAAAREHLTAEGVLMVEVGNSAAAVMEAWPELPFTWLEFEHGGSGVFLLTAEELG